MTDFEKLVVTMDKIQTQSSLIDEKLEWLMMRQRSSEAADAMILERLGKLETLVDGLVRA
ncbi:hypothetical protein [Caballeronia sordidicola]|uniref:Uncharacterized protein n=1 Tax=Caballeronia sordidicola TaxID=196367 RepID=A0A242ME88_CABSO|nr:hypothetical protein [Caballeronia sordidicola]OTP69459.1 hypothetical protein PAMC26577_30940 [Caballeronia sordidicola]